MSLLPHLEVETGSRPDASIIWLHGLGADGHDFQPIVSELQLPQTTQFRFIFPHAPSIPVTINNGYVMPAWYDILDMTIDRKVDETQLRASSRKIEEFIDNEMKRGISSERIIIAGFSQGGAVAFETVLTSKLKLGGLLAMSTYFATKDSIQYSEQNKQTPVEIHHGTYDPVVPESLGQSSFALLKSKEYPVEYKSYPMEHAVCPQQIKDISNWLQNRLL
ncbi:alpha/beta hydrolase [Pleionea sediminis]|uniref:alpha/beta hydrolase n=1 Tax=Pleionea sediminis TaxID=2569479 RepID=UPI0011857EDA|nr:dienelactone hydrolase family protein [Pleionea sediminis]